MIAFALVLLVLSFGDIRRVVDSCLHQNISNAIVLRNGGDVYADKRYFFTEDEYHMAMWLKENTEEKDYIALDLFEYDGMRKEEMLGVFSERFIWNDGQYATDSIREARRKMVQDAFKGDKEALEGLKEENVRYVIRTLSQNDSAALDGEEVVYDQGGYIVYKLY